MNEYAGCVQNNKIQAEKRLQFYTKKIAFVSFSASRCLFNENRTVSECKDYSVLTAGQIMDQELLFIKNWNLAMNRHRNY